MHVHTEIILTFPVLTKLEKDITPKGSSKQKAIRLFIRFIRLFYIKIFSIANIFFDTKNKVSGFF